MKVLVINAGSSSLKYQLIDMTNENVLAIGNCERIGLDGSFINHSAGEYKIKNEVDFPTHKEALEELIKLLSTGENAVIASMSEIDAIGHRIVQGAELFNTSVLATDKVFADIEPLSDLAPLHNPAGIMAAKTCKNVFGENVPMVFVFDTSFHSTLPAKAYTYPITYDLIKKYSIRRYGFHGTSHRFVSARMAEIVNKPIEGLKIITCHLGNGCSISAVDRGKSVDTTMGFTPLDGVPMGTRCGGIDPSIVTFLMEKENLTPAEMNDIMNKKSGYFGVSGISNDNRDLTAAANEGNERARLALDVQYYQIKKTIGAYAAAMNGVDYVVFTGGIGENAYTCREAICSDLEFFGIELDKEANKNKSGSEAEISTASSKVKVFVLSTNEELLIARDTKEIVSAL